MRLLRCQLILRMPPLLLRLSDCDLRGSTLRLELCGLLRGGCDDSSGVLHGAFSRQLLFLQRLDVCLRLWIWLRLEEQDGQNSGN